MPTPPTVPPAPPNEKKRPRSLRKTGAVVAPVASGGACSGEEWSPRPGGGGDCGGRPSRSKVSLGEGILSVGPDDCVGASGSFSMFSLSRAALHSLASGFSAEAAEDLRVQSPWLLALTLGLK